MKDLIIEIPFETVPKKNSRINTSSGRSFPSLRYKEWHRKAINYVFIYKNRIKDSDYPISLEVTFQHSDKRHRDLDNQLSSILDLLKDALVIKDDSCIYINEIYLRASNGKESKCLLKIKGNKNDKY